MRWKLLVLALAIAFGLVLFAAWNDESESGDVRRTDSTGLDYLVPDRDCRLPSGESAPKPQVTGHVHAR